MICCYNKVDQTPALTASNLHSCTDDYRQQLFFANSIDSAVLKSHN